MAKKSLPAVIRLRELFSYNSDTGVLTWAMKPSAKSPIVLGEEAGCLTRFGYRIVSFDGVQVQTHRVVWAFEHGAWPDCQIDHLNGRRDDNRISNLRLATPSENSRNRGMRSDNTSGIAGVDWCKRRNKWRAKLKIGGVTKTLGVFSSLALAKAARVAAEAQHYGAFAPQRT